jgi:hypothetical protein
MRFPLLFCFFLIIGSNLFSQGKEHLHPCGSPPISQKEWKEILTEVESQKESGLDSQKLYIPMTLFNVGKSDSTSFYSTAAILTALSRLNQDYDSVGMQFYLNGPIRRLENTAWWDHKSVIQGHQMMIDNNVPNTMNVYIVSNPASNCGYNLPSAGIAMNRSCMSPSDHTFAHEIGHNFYLPHPFLGWEGKRFNLANPTPDRVTYDYTFFKDIFPIDTTLRIIDTALVEYFDGRNSAIAADQVEDSKADYLSYRWQCTANNFSVDKQRDPAGTEFFSDGSLFMSYAADECQSRFSKKQIGVMRYMAQYGKRKNYLLNPRIPENKITLNPANLISPVGSQVTGVNNITLRWNKVPNATSYLVQLSRLSNYLVFDLDIVVTDTFINVPTTLSANRNYFWRVRAFNSYYFDNPFTPNGVFKTAVTSSEELGFSWAKEIKLYPNPIESGVTPNLTINMLESGSIQWEVYNLIGGLIKKGDLNLLAGENYLSLPVVFENKGLYLLKLTKEGSSGGLKFIVE